MAGRAVKTILLIENDIEAARLIQGMLNDSIAGLFEVAHVESMDAAERYLAKRSVDIVLLDMGITTPPGLETLRRVRAVAPRVSIVLLSSAKDEEIAVFALQDGAQDYLIKGQIEPRELMRALLNSAERKMIEEVLFVEKERAQVTLNSIGDAVICTDTSGKVTFLNPVAERMTGWMLKDAVGRLMVDTFQIVNAVNRKAILDPMAKATSKNQTGKIPLNSVLIRRDGNEVFIEDSVAPIRDREGQVTGAVIVFRDVTATRTLEEKLTHSAHHDFLTGLPNRMLLSTRVCQAISHARRTKGRAAVLFLDLDGFKEINDSLGHLIGDKLLQSVAKRLLSCVRGPDTVSRQGGDEFVVLLRELQNPEDAATTAARLLNAVADVHLIDQHEIRVTTSIGLSIYPSDAKDAEGLIRKADTAMYHAKKNGRHIYQFFKPEMTIDPSDLQSAERDLRHAKDLEIELQSQGSPVHARSRAVLSGIRQTAILNAAKHKSIRPKSVRDRGRGGMNGNVKS
jgi:diguanylate cyclase (GGDEF)-like protein/PAS domain S-box-containing protein